MNWGGHAGQHFYTMDHVAGGSLSDLCHNKPVHAKRAAELLKQLAETVHYAHGEGVLHRNLNPANVLLTTTGVPRITGFAFPDKMHAWTNSETLSRTQGRQNSELVGSQSPEQALGESRLMGPATDVYGLGAVLYSLLTCRAPFVGDSPADTIIQLLKGDPVSPRTLNPNVPRNLELICLKCLSRLPCQRYDTAQMLVVDLSRLLEGRPIIPQPIGLLSRLVKWVRRHRISIIHGYKRRVAGFGLRRAVHGDVALPRGEDKFDGSYWNDTDLGWIDRWTCRWHLLPLRRLSGKLSLGNWLSFCAIRVSVLSGPARGKSDEVFFPGVGEYCSFHHRDFDVQLVTVGQRHQ